jgi:hypothetical protein
MLSAILLQAFVRFISPCFLECPGILYHWPLLKSPVIVLMSFCVFQEDFVDLQAVGGVVRLVFLSLCSVVRLCFALCVVRLCTVFVCVCCFVV